MGATDCKVQGTLQQLTLALTSSIFSKNIINK
jgi:hypothetical protein